MLLRVKVEIEEGGAVYAGREGTVLQRKKECGARGRKRSRGVINTTRIRAELETYRLKRKREKERRTKNETKTKTEKGGEKGIGCL
jgi:hypothetical protein